MAEQKVSFRLAEGVAGGGTTLGDGRSLDVGDLFKGKDVYTTSDQDEIDSLRSWSGVEEVATSTTRTSREKGAD